MLQAQQVIKMVKIKNKHGKLVKIKDKENNIVWDDRENIQRSKISQASRDSQKTAISNDNLEKRVKNLEEILFGKDIHE